jgi:hypothetical protein
MKWIARAIAWLPVMLAFAIATLAWWYGRDPDAGLPREDALVAVSGRLEELSESRYSIDFRLEGEAREFQYLGKARGWDRVRSALEGAEDRAVTVWIDRAEQGATGDLTVYAVAVDGRVVRSYDEVRDAWRRDNALAPWLAGAMLLCGVVLAFVLLRDPKAERG